MTYSQFRRRGFSVELGVLLGVVILCGLAATAASEVTSGVITQGLISLLLVVSLYIFSGNSGIVSFGHPAIAFAGAYAASLFIIEPGQKAMTVPGLPEALISAQSSAVVSVAIGAAFGAVFAGVVWLPLVRLSGIRSSLASFAVLLVVLNVANNWQDVTGGQTGLSGLMYAPSVLSICIWTMASLVVAAVYGASRSGRRLRASREDEVAAEACGINIALERWIAIVVSGAVAGVAGAIYAQYLGTLTPSMFGLDLDFLTVAMLLVGGMFFLRGAVVGALLLTAVAGIFGRIQNGGTFGFITIDPYPGLAQVAFALLTLIVVLVRPEGLAAKPPQFIANWLHRRREGKAAGVDTVEDSAEKTSMEVHS
ncbi:MAG: branched-chain amino acid ABC transporter permease [Actinobacteria bacterium]|nr:branched-chain amino acid ABC transporter permease [Actinomycetota bacterium]